ncbi:MULTISPECIES: DUF4247 domain-containing protein [Paenibacillus]|jgi:hypothetical protein|uniref:DUF4247 domain-containing protein n=1 Tax=Paenibacillus TaxID=44249 RepID=UPI00203C19B2|nr:DUF4247 domain-containing protein [Paenibacillus lactis]MCM3495000.1 DUF4247 domain-containing protein [Paenibacillus lactis]
MKERSFLTIKVLLVVSLFVSLLSGCGAPNVTETYPLESVNRDGNATSYVYRAADKSVPEVADELMSAGTPDQSSPVDNERMFLVYGDEYYHLQQDPQKPEDTLIEIDSKEYVQRNYDSSFLQGYLTAVLIGNLFDTFGGGSYRGYTSKDVYKPREGNYRKPTSQDKKAAPPLTVDRSGKITRRGQDKVGTGGGLFQRTPDNGGTRGSIERGERGGGLFDSPKRSYKKPKTRTGSGKIYRRGRR